MTDIIDRFSTCYQVNPHHHQVQDAKLKANLECLLKQHPELNNETALLKYFCDRAAKNNSNSLAIEHLLAYVDVACYSAAIATYEAFKTPDLALEDYLQIARVYVADRAVKLCAKFDRTQSQIQTYLHYPLREAIMSEARKHQEIQRLSDWRLLRSFSKKARKTALENFGIKDGELSSNCLLVLQGFCEVYAPVKAGRNQRLPEPTADQWQAIAQFCTEQQLPHCATQFTVQEVKSLLQTCINALRASTRIEFDFLDAKNKKLKDKITDKFEQESWCEEQEAAKCEILQQITTELASAIASLSPDARKMLILEHGFIGFNQTKIGEELGIEQYRVSRQLNRSKRIILEVFAQWSKREIGINLTVETVDRLSIELDEWLTWYCQKAILYKFLQTALKLHPALSLEIPLLSCYYGAQKPDAGAIAQNLNLTPTELQAKLVQIKTILQAELHDWLQKILALKPCSLKAIDRSSALLVEQFLAAAPYAFLTLERR